MEFKTKKVFAKKYKKDEHKSLKGQNVFYTIQYVCPNTNKIKERMVVITDRDLYFALKEKVEYLEKNNKL